jgi:hypothetical protein
MTTTQAIGYNQDSACRFNAKNCKSLGWYLNIPLNAISAFPMLSSDPLGDEYLQTQFARAVYSMQLTLFDGDEDEADGKLGRGTLARMLRTYDPIPDESRYYLHHRRRVEPPTRDNICPVYTYKHPLGLDLHDSGKYNRHGEPPTHIMLHWSATTTIKGCFNALSNKGASSHIAIGLNGDGEPVIIQWVDTKYDTAHSGIGKRTRAKYPDAISGNRDTVGMDICSTPVVSAQRSLEKKGHKVKAVDNNWTRGDQRVLTLDPWLARATREAVLDQCAIHGIPFVSPISASVMGPVKDNFHGIVSKEFYTNNPGVYSHTNTHPGKWDVFPLWWEQIFGECNENA